MSDNVRRWALPILLSLIIHCAAVLAINVPPRLQVRSSTPAKTINVKLVSIETNAAKGKVAATNTLPSRKTNNPPAMATDKAPKAVINKEKRIDKPKPPVKTVDKKIPSETHVTDQNKGDQIALGNADSDLKDRGQNLSASAEYEEGKGGPSDALNFTNEGSLEQEEKVPPIASDLDIVRGAKPIYPLASRRRGEEGTVLIYVRLSHDGAVVEAKVYKSSGYEQLDESALKAVKRWVFKTSKESELLVPVIFKLNP